MKREILFRRAHFDVDNKFMYFTYWGFLNHKDEFDSKCFKSPSSSNRSRSHIDEQFTNLTDKNGVKIFENDKTNFGTVLFKYGCFGIVGDYDFYPMTDWNLSELKVIGNIHE